MWIKFKKGHPEYAYFVGDVTEIDDEIIEAKRLNEDGYTIPATKAEIAAAKEVIAAEEAAMLQQTTEQASAALVLSEIERLKAENAALRAAAESKDKK